MSATERRLLTPVGLMAVLGLLAALAGDPRIFAFAVPAPPTGLTAVVSGSTVALTWQSGGGRGHPYRREAGSVPERRDLGAWPTIAPGLTATGVPAGR